MASTLGVLVAIHGVWRWAVLIALVVAALVATRRVTSVAAGVVDLQLALGIALYAVTPMRASPFFGLIHPATMIAVVTLVHVGNIRVRRNLGGLGTRATLWGAALLAIAATPWWRPLLRVP